MGYIAKQATDLAELMAGKNKDYARATDEFSNFREAAQIAGLLPEDVIMMFIGTKIARIRNLTRDGWRDVAANNESLQDSFKDLAGYALIAAAWLDRMEEKGLNA